MKKNRTKKIALYGMFIALAFIFNYVERLLPFNFGIPGIKLGLANIVVLMALYTLGYKAAFTLTVVRVLLTGFSYGSMYHVMYGMAGAMLSFLFMSVLHKTKKFSIVGVSIIGGLGHNIGQILVAMWILSESLLYYLPFLLVGGAISGTLIGILGSLIVTRVQKLVKQIE